MKKYERPNKGQYIYSIGQLTTYTPSSPEDMQKVEKIFKKHRHYIDFNRERGYYQFGWDEDPEEMYEYYKDKMEDAEGVLEIKNLLYKTERMMTAKERHEWKKRRKKKKNRR